MSGDLNRSISDRLRYRAGEEQVEVGRLRRHLAFERVLARLSRSSTWVLKGGFCLEARLGLDARATRDLDLAMTGPALTGPLDLQDLLAEALENDLGDGFTFEVGLPRSISPDEAGNPGWRISLGIRVAGREFESVKVDLAARPEEIAGATEFLVLPSLLPGFDAVTIPAVNVAQHAAEKTHAYARVYAYDRPSSRVKDLVDLMLLVDAGLLNGADWGARLIHVFRVRDGTAPPPDLPAPPASWAGSYAAASAELGLSAATAEAAHTTVSRHYRRAITAQRHSRNEI